MLTQNNWTGGVGADPGAHEYASATNMDTSTPGQLKIDTTNGTYTNWCNTGAGECDTDWTHRQPLYLHNQGGDQLNDTIVVVKIPYVSSMNSDYSDLRFVSEDGITAFDYALVNSTPESVLAYIKIPLINAYDFGNVFVYYGNSSATSLSNRSAVFTYHDDLDQGMCASATIYCVPGWSEVVDNEIRFVGESVNVTVGIFDQNDRSINRAYQLESKFDMSSYSCDQTLNGGIGPDLNDNVNGVGISTSNQVKCDDQGKYWSPMKGISSNGNYYSDNTDTIRIRDGQWVISQFVNLASGGTMIRYSADGGATFTEPNYYTRDTQTFIPDNMFVGNGGTDSFNFRIKNLFGYPFDPSVRTTLGAEQVLGGYSGSLESAVFDLGSNNTTFGALQVATTWYSSTGNYAVYVRGGVNAPSDAIYEFCGALTGGQLSGSSCMPDHTRYIQYKIVMNDSSTNYLEINEVSLEYTVDNTPPDQVSNLVMFDNVRNEPIADGAWTNTNPALNWDASTDSGVGMLGYCFYLGTDQSADLTTTAGIITASSIADTNGACAFATTPSISTDLGSLPHSALVNGETYYFKISAIDLVGNLSTPTMVSFKYDTDQPSIGTAFNYPAVSNTKGFTITWLTLGALNDATSGVAGLKYCVTGMSLGFTGCDQSDHNWYGADHSSGDIWDTSDVVPFPDGYITLDPADYDRADDSTLGFAGVTVVVVVAIDNAGNPSNSFSGNTIVSRSSAAAPTGLAVNPGSNTTNEFSFTWNVPSFYLGSPNNINYCWTVNELIASDGNNCNWTGKGITQLANGPYATQQGVNTLYLAAKDDTGNFDGALYASVNFTATTLAPGVPQNLDISDVSTRATSTWKLALSWSAPNQVGSGIAGYRIYRSTDNSSFTQVGTTSADNLSFIDSGLSQTTYYYNVKACDNAGSCSVASSTVSKRPTGRFTEPASLVTGPAVSNLSTRKATVSWTTDRDSDSKVAFGTSSGQYQAEEVANSTQTPDHTINLTNLQPGTQYFYVAKWTDQDGNTGTSPEKSFTTAPAPTVSEVNVTGLGISSATINFTTKNAAKAKLYYGLSDGFGGVKTINTSTDESVYSLPIDGLSDGTKYFYKINPIDADGNEYDANMYSLTTPARPRISNLRFQSVDGEPSSTLKVTWNTNVPATSRISYGPSAQDQEEAIDSSLVTDHELIIRGLTDDTDYTLTAESRDAAGNVALSDLQKFHTALDTRPPKISDVTIETGLRGSGAESRGQIIISWRTDEPATSQVAFGQGQTGELGSKTPEDGRLTTEHVVIVSDLPTSSIYRVQALSRDKADNQSNADAQSAIIGRGADNIFSIIFNALQKIFGLGQN